MPDRDGVPILIRAENSTELIPVNLLGKGDAFDEAWIQDLVQKHPCCVPIAQIEPGFGTLRSVCRELPTVHGYVDNLLMTSAGDIVLVETKLWRNPQARREVVAQALDYASCVFRMDYETFEAAIMRGSFGSRAQPSSLYALFSDDPEAPSEKEFIENVSTNLDRGNIVVIVLGDGIRTEVKRLADVLQSHAGFHFTFALVELRVFKTPENGTLVLPSVLAQTEMIERGIVRLENGKLSVSTPPRSLTETRGGSISAEKFFENLAAIDTDAPAAIKAFIARIEALGAYPEYRKSLNIKWDPPAGGKTVNLGYLTPQGHLWTDAVNWSIPHEISHSYLEDLARRLGGEVNRNSSSGNFFVTLEGHAPRISDIKNRLDRWFEAAASLIEILKAKDS